MPKKHFKAIADILAQYSNDDACFSAIEIRDHIARELADYFTTQNPNFDRARFMAAVKQ